jgi:pyrroline-5-carboxylate reductase
VQRIGIIGVGEIGRALVDGLCDGIEEPPEIYLSPRSARTAAELSQQYPNNVRVCADNQDVVNRSELVILAVRPQDRAEALTGLRVESDKVVVSVLTGVAISELRHTLDTDAPVVRAIPLPSARERRSVTVTCPSHPAVDDLFGGLGGTLPVTDEATLNTFQVLTGTLTTHYQYLATLADWAARQGIPADGADRYLRGLFQDVGRALGDDRRSLEQLAGDHETPKGLNERLRTTWFDPANAEALTKALDALLTDLK